jgi:uncharacterized repeat protein (TIGR03943 family)
MANLELFDNYVAPRNIQREKLVGWAKSVVLVGLGIFFIYSIASGNLTNYINERFAWLSYVAAGLFLLLGAANTVDLWLHRDYALLDRSHAPITWTVIAIVAIPLVLGTLVPSRPLGSAAAQGGVSLSAASITKATSFTTDPLKWNVLDWLRAFNMTDDVNSFNGKQADVVGFVYREATFPDNQFMVTRFTVSCCVADASALGLPVVSDKASQFPADTWVEIKGTLKVDKFKGDNWPILQAVSIEKIAQPEHPYLYP